MKIEEAGNVCVVGLQWGDEGKGRFVDAIVRHFDTVVRYSGGANAGHTVIVGEDKFALHQLPSGVLHPGLTCMITGGSVIDPAILLSEIESLRSRGIELGDNLRISARAHLVFPYHLRQDVLAERAALPGGKIGTTARGIGPCYADKVSRRWGVRVCELLHPDNFRARLDTIIAHKNAYLNALYDAREPFDAAAIAEEYLAFAEQLRPFITDTTAELNRRLRAGKRVLFEGAQGCLLDIDHGTYPYVTSAHAGVGGVSSGAGVPPTAIHATIGVLKAYCTRVGGGPFPTELADAKGDEIRERGHEYGTTTGRPRRCGWFDAVAARYAGLFCGPAGLAISHLDTLSGMDELKICTGYRIGDERVNDFPADTYVLEQCTPIYETLPGWSENIEGCRDFAELPAAAQGYCRRIAELCESRLTMLSVGPERTQLIRLDA